MESASSSIALVERGDSEPIPRHPDFRIFAAMNPATDAGALSYPILSTTVPLIVHRIRDAASIKGYRENNMSQLWRCRPRHTLP